MTAKRTDELRLIYRQNVESLLSRKTVGCKICLVDGENSTERFPVCKMN